MHDLDSDANFLPIMKDAPIMGWHASLHMGDLAHVLLEFHISVLQGAAIRSLGPLCMGASSVCRAPPAICKREFFEASLYKPQGSVEENFDVKRCRVGNSRRHMPIPVASCSFGAECPRTHRPSQHVQVMAQWYTLYIARR